jgi:hypothetical protein
VSDIDPDTGMPALPDGQFWRVRQKYDDRAGHYVVELHTRKRRGSKLVGTIIVCRYIADVTAGKVLIAARELLEAIASADEREALKGDYPPKRLGGSK